MLFSSASRPTSSIDEGIVIQVDSGNFCKVRTIRGQILSNVTWTSPYGGSDRGGDRSSACMGDRVLLSFGLGYPVIIGFLPKIQSLDGSAPLSISTGESVIDTGNYGAGGTVAGVDQSKPKDMISGERVLTSSGGAMVALLKAGSLVLRSSKYAQVFLNKFHGLVRVFSKNWEHFSDLHSDVIKNFNGRIYRYLGYSNDFNKAKNEDYQYHQYIGDTSASEAVKTNYHLLTSAPAANTLIYKEQVTDNSQVEIMRSTVDLTGGREVWIKNGSDFTRVVSTGTAITISFKDLATIRVDATGIKSTFGDGESFISSSSNKMTFGSHSVTISASGVAVV